MGSESIGFLAEIAYHYKNYGYMYACSHASKCGVHQYNDMTTELIPDVDKYNYAITYT